MARLLSRGTLRTRCAASLVFYGLAPSLLADTQSTPVRVAQAPSVASTQTTTAQADSTQIAALVRYPAFFHNQTVIVQGTVRISGSATWLETSGDVRIRLLRLVDAIDGRRIQVRGLFIDVGRLPANDPRLAKLGLDSLTRGGGRREGPRPGELLVVSVELASVYFAPTGPAGLQAVVLDPDRFQNQGIVVTGQFRGRNLVGDQPAALGGDKWEFVLRNGTSSIWVVGRRPQGFDFNLDPAAPNDVGRWLRVSGVVRRHNELVYLEADAIERGDNEPETAPAARTGSVPAVRPPEVTFSLPSDGESDISLKVVVRVQFSRVMNADSFAGRVRATYVDSAAAGAAPVRNPDFTAVYVAKDQVLEISFARPLERMRRLRVELLEGIAAPDGSTLRPCTLTFTTGER